MSLNKDWSSIFIYPVLDTISLTDNAALFQGSYPL